MDKMKIHLIQIKINELLAVCDEHNNDPGELINILHAAQGIFGYLPREVQEIIASRLHIPVSRVYGVVTFYSFFTMTPKGNILFPSVWERPVMYVELRKSWMSSNASWRSKLERLLLTACSHWIVYVVWALAGWPRSLRLPEKSMDV